MSDQPSDHTDWREHGRWVGAWHVEPQLNRLTREEEQVRIEPKMMDVLVCLIERAGKTVTKEQFMERVWRGTVVTDDVLARCISELRKVLGDDAQAPTYIETIRKTGYRLIAPVRPVADASGPAPGEASAEASGEASGEASSALRPKSESAPARKAPVVEVFVPSRHALARRVAVPGIVQRLVRQGRRLRRQPWRGVPAALVAVLVLIGAGGLIWAAWPAPPPEPPKTVPFTSFPGEEYDPALSPDGERLAFVWDGDGAAGHDIYLKESGTETPLRLTTHPAQERSPTWSPDGKRIAFVRVDGGVHTLHIVPVLGGSPREVARLGARQVEGLVWSPDGTTLAFALQQAPYGPFHIQLLSLETLQQRALTTPPAHYRGDLAPRFSPDGRRVAFLRSVVDRVQDIYVVSVEGETPRPITRDQADVSGFDWTARGDGLVFSSNRDGNFSLWRVAAAPGATPRWMPLSGIGSDLHQPSIAPTGQMALMQRSRNTNIWQLQRTPINGRFDARRVIASTQWDSNPDIAPDGRRVAFTSKRSGSFEVWTSAPDGSEPLQLTTFGGPFLSTPRWGPDGTRLAFVARADHQADVFTIDRGGGPVRQLTNHPAEDVAPSWSHDGQWVYFGSNRSGTWQIWKMPADSGAARRVTTEGGFAAFESIDGRYLYYVKKDRPGIWRKRLRGEGESWLLSALDPDDWGNWAVTTHGIYFVYRAAEQPVLAYYSFTSGRIFRLQALPDVPRHPSLAVAPRGAWFLYTQVDRSESDILLVQGDVRTD